MATVKFSCQYQFGTALITQLIIIAECIFSKGSILRIIVVLFFLLKLFYPMYLLYS